MVPELRAANRQLMRQINEMLVLNLVREQKSISRTDLATVTRLSPATVSGITAELIDQGLVYERTTGESTGGRRPVLLAFNADAGFACGIKLTDSHLVLVLTDLDAHICDQRLVPLEADKSPGCVVRQIATAVTELREAHPEKRVFGVGIGMAGGIDRPTGTCRFSPFLLWRDVPIRALLEEALDLPVVVENDVNTLTFAEGTFGAGSSAHSFVVITLGRGVGFGMMLNGSLYRGDRGLGGELGHVTVDAKGPRCECGKRGCLEAVVGLPAVLRRIKDAADLEDATIADVGGLMAANHQPTASLLDHVGTVLGIQLANLVNLLEPALLIVGGEGAALLDLIREPLRHAFERHCFAGLAADIRLVIEPWDDYAWARGAAGLLLQDVFSPFREFADDQPRPALTPRALNRP